MEPAPCTYIRNPFEDVPGIRAAYFRWLYRFAKALEKRIEPTQRMLELNERRRACHRQWDKKHASPITDALVSAYLWAIFTLIAALIFMSLFGLRKSSDSSPRQPRQEMLA